jgi:homocysteine S-methyltransferase
VDLLLFETLTTASEIEAAATLGAEEARVPFGAGLTCGPDARTLAGVSMAEAWARLRGAAPALVFVQCTRYDRVGPALRALRESIGDESTCGVYANDGRVWEGRIWRGDRVTPGEYADAAMRWVEAGARVVGGCCGTSPEHVRELRRRLG